MLYGDESTVAISETEEAKMTITLAPQTEAKLKEMATREGRDENTLADALLAEVLEEANRDFEEACEAVSESLAGDPKHDVSLEEYRAQFDLEREVRQRKREGKKDKVAA
jgi:hypothetical protein